MLSPFDLSQHPSPAMMIERVEIEFDEKNHVAGSNAGEIYRSLISQNALPEQADREAWALTKASIRSPIRFQ